MPILNRLLTLRYLQAVVALALAAFAFPLAGESLGTHDNPGLLSSGGSQAPLVLFINGPGRVLRFHDGQMLEVGLEYRAQAIPDRGAVFIGWNRVNVFTDTEVVYDSSNNPTGNRTIVTSAPVPISIRSPDLRFAVQPATVLLDIPGVRSLTQTTGWQANFVRR